MATEMGPKIGINGEARFRRDLAAINAALKTTEAEMKKVGTEFEGSDDKIGKLSAELKLMEKQLASTNKKQDTARQALENATKTYGENSTQAEKWRRIIVECEEANIKLTRSIASTKTELANASHSMADAGDSADKMAENVQQNTEAISGLCSVVTAAALVNGIKAIAAVMQECIEASIEFESAITGVYKTVDGTDKQLAELAVGIKNLATEIPSSTTELAGVAESAGQLGIARDSILNFTKTMVMLGTTTNMEAEEAATALARFANVAGTSPDNYDRLGAVIVALGNNLATTESEITEMGQRLASAGTLAGLTESQIMALAAAMSSVGIEAEAGGTAMTQTLSAIDKAVNQGGDKLDKFAAIAEMSADEFAAAWQNNPIVALQAFIGGLGDLEEKGESSILALEELGLSGIRQSNMLRSLSLAAEQMGTAVNLADTAWKENTALLDEASLRYGTTESKLQLLSNATDRLAAAYGDTLTPALGDFAAGAANAANWLATLIEEHPKLGDAVTVAGAALTTFAGTSVVIAAAECQKLVAVLNALKDAALKNPYALAASGVAALISAIVLLASNSEKAEKKYDSLIEKIKESQKQYTETAEELAANAEKIKTLAATYEQLQKGQDGSAASAEALRKTQEQLISLMPELSGYIDAETGVLSENWQQQMDATQAANEHAAALENKARIESQLAEVQAELSIGEAELQKLAEDGYVAEELRIDGYAKANPLIREKAERCLELSSEVSQLQAAEQELTAQQAAANDELAKFGTACDTLANGTDNVEQKINILTGQLSELALAYNQAYNRAYESISSQIGLFDELNGNAKASITDMIAALESQLDYMEKYADNLTRAVERGVDDGLIAKLSDGSQESAKYLAALASATDEQIAAINDNLAKVEKGKDILSSAIALAETDANNILMAISQKFANLPAEMDLSEDALQSAINTMQGYITGIDGKTGALYTKMREVATGALNTWRTALDEHSPSRKYKKSGENSMDGYEDGAVKKADEVNATMAKIGQAVFESFGDGAAAGSTTVMSDMQAEMDAIWKLAQTKSKDFSTLQKALKNAYSANLFDEETYYKKLKALRSQYLSVDSDEWTSISLDIYNYEKKKLEESNERFLESYKATLEAAAAASKESLADIKSQYEDVVAAQDKMRDKLQDYGDLYSTVTLNYSDGSTGEYYQLADWQAQIDALHEYQTILDNLKGRNISESLLNEVLGMGVDEAVRYGRELLNQSDDEWTAYNRQWEEKQQLAAKIAENYYKSELTALEDEYAEKLRSGLDGLKDISTDAGENVVECIIKGMNEQEEELRRQVREITETIEDELRNSFDMPTQNTQLDSFRALVDSTVPRDLAVNYSQQGSYQRDSSMLEALGTMFGSAPSGDMTVVFRVDDLDFARVTLPAFRQASAENPVVEVDF